MLRAAALVLVLALPTVAAAETSEAEHHHTHHRHIEHGRHGHEHRLAHPPARHVVLPPPVVAAPAKPAPPPPPVGSVTGLPLPRFASLRSEEVNMRSGPGTRYPIQWVYKRRDLPVEIEREFDVWRLVRTEDGTEGWVHQATLIGDRTFVVVSAAAPQGPGAQTLRATEAANGAPAAYLKPGVIGRVLACAAGSDWCRVEVHGTTGFLPRQAMWGLLPDEVVLAH